MRPSPAAAFRAPPGLGEGGSARPRLPLSLRLPQVPGGRRAAPRVDPRREPRGPAEPPGLAARPRGHPLLAALRRGRLRALRAAAEAAAGGRALPLPPPGACGWAAALPSPRPEPGPRRCAVTSPLPSPLGAAGRRPEERAPRPSPEAASPQPPRRGRRRGPQLQPEGAAGSGRGGTAAAGAAAAAASCGREVLPRAPGQNGGEHPPGAGGEAAAF